MKVALFPTLIVFICCFVLSNNATYAKNDNSKLGKTNKSKNSLQLKAAGCSPATGRKILEFNNVSALIETGGSMWQDRSRNEAAYEVPAGSGEKVIFAGSIWMGGLDVNNQLKLAALTFREGNDFWAGPLSVTPGTGTPNPLDGFKDYGPAGIDPETCVEYDQFYITTRMEVEEFNSWYLCTQDPDCDESLDFPNYSPPSSILTWPAHGDESKFQDKYLAPFYDRNGDGAYDPIGAGDYPWYDLAGDLDCRTDRRVTLYGDYNMWWVFNDKGNIHTETQGDPIGMEIKAQAFSFATNDEINSMTFYNYEMINRSTQTLTNTYFAVWVDSDIGFAEDDYVGCDVQRGLGYSYNATAIDAGGDGAIGANPPAIGIDFFEGPYQDNDGINNPLTTDISLALAQNGIPYAGLGIGYGDTTDSGDPIIDNERLGMKRFTYFDRILPDNIYGDPDIAVEYYNYMRGFWKDNTQFVYGATGNSSSAGATNIPTNYCFTGDSDPLNWATQGVDPGFFWSEQSPTGLGSTANPKGDRRFVQAAGPFTLEPGALNNITYGVVYAKASSGDPFQSVELVRKADDKAQALFDNCFRILNGPDSPNLAVQELDKELILHLNGTEIVEAYEEIDPNILGVHEDSAKYFFQGYQLYQLVDQTVDPSELMDVDRARLIAQCDVQDGVNQLINYNFDDALSAAVPTEMVNGLDEGIKHSFQITQDAFAQGDLTLVNFKKYYFMVISYGYNNYKNYDPSDPTSFDGQQKPYKAGRKSITGGAIKSYVGIPHIPVPELGGTVQLTEYGSGPEITRVEGRGNATNILELTLESENEILEKISPQKVTYANGFGPVKVKVIDPLQVQAGNYTLKILGNGSSLNSNAWKALQNSQWELVREHDNEIDVINSIQSIQVGNEQLIPEWGISIYIEQYEPELTALSGTYLPSILASNIEYSDSSNRWLSGVSDVDGATAQNWIRSGTAEETETIGGCDDPANWNDIIGIDDLETMENIIDGTWAPYRMVAAGNCAHEPVSELLEGTREKSDMKLLSSYDIVFTADRSKWTRCPVLETQDNLSLSWAGNTPKQGVKLMPSIDKYGVPTTNPDGPASTNPEAPNYKASRGMGWFPGYAIDLNSGERCNIAYGEDSWLGNNGGKDMLFNPSGNMYTQFGNPLFGGKHYVYVFRNASKDGISWDKGQMPAYDAGEFYMNNWDNTNGSYKIWWSCSWVGMPILSSTSSNQIDNTEEYVESDYGSFIKSDARIKLRVSSPYLEMGNNMMGWNTAENDWDPYYTFSMDDIAVINNNLVAADSACDLFNVVPNPYYAYSSYELNKIDNVVKVVNLPFVCAVNIYTPNGTLVRGFKKDSPVTYMDWDLKNYAGIPIASGVYLIHIKVPGGCERVLKWFGVVRPPDLDSF